MIKSRAIVLHRYAYSDSSWIVKALTEEVGIVSFIVKGGKRKESPFKGALDPLALSEVVFRQNPNAELQFIKEATLIEWRKNLREDLLALAKAQVMAEILLRYAPQGVPLQSEFMLLEQATSELDLTGTNALHDNQGNYDTSTDLAQAQIPKSNIFARWLLDTCDAWGYSLDLATCSRCGKILDAPPAHFIPETVAICRERTPLLPAQAHRLPQGNQVAPVPERNPQTLQQLIYTTIYIVTSFKTLQHSAFPR